LKKIIINKAKQRKRWLVGLTGIIVSIMSVNAFATYGKVPSSHADPKIVNIDEEKYLGVSLDKSIVFNNDKGEEFTLGDMLSKPLILVLSYYRCDGSCPAINKSLNRKLKEVDNWNIGDDYNVLTASFDVHDNPQTLTEFKQHTGFASELPDGWIMATFKNPETIKQLTDSVGYKFFWEPRDRIFLHPSIYIVVAPNGRVTRFLYAASTTAEDLEFSITKALGSELSPSNIINFVVGACYSYNYEDGKYTLNYPIFVALAALVMGIILLSSGSIIMKRRVRT